MVLSIQDIKEVDIMIEYEVMISPFSDFKDFDKMKKKEAEEYFNWYVSELENRMRILKAYIQKDLNEETINLDYTPESLIPL